MRKRLAGTFGVLALLAGGCAPAGPAPAPEPLYPQPWVPTPRVYSLIGERARLELTAEQVGVLDSIGFAVAEENRPLVRRAQELQGERGRINRERAELLRPVLVQIRDNNQRAMDRIREVLTEEQQGKVCEVFGAPSTNLTPEQRRRAEREERVREEIRRRRGEMAADSLVRNRAGIWPWCGPQPMATDTAEAAAPRR